MSKSDFYTDKRYRGFFYKKIVDMNKNMYISVKMYNIHEHIEEIKRGCGATESKKAYNRKKNKGINHDYDCSFLFI